MNKTMHSSLNKNTVSSKQPICTVLMSAYNGEKYIEEQVESILNQRGVYVNIVIRDDGSKDRTVEILKALKKKYEEQIELIIGENCGIHQSFKKLIFLKEKTGYIAFADQDDRWDSVKLLTAINTLKQHNASFYSCAARLVDDDLKPIGKTTANEKKYDHYMWGHSKLLTPGAQGCTIVITKEFLELLQNGYYPDDIGHDTWLSAVAYHCVNCVYDPEPHMDYRQHEQSWTGNRKNTFSQLMREYKFFINGMERYAPLAQDILKGYSEQISKDDKEVLCLMQAKNKSLKDRLRLIMYPGFEKYGCLQNVVFKGYILVGKC